jgi:hypothetical protein
MARLESVRVPSEAYIPSSTVAVPDAAVTSRHSALVRVTHWIEAQGPGKECRVAKFSVLSGFDSMRVKPEPQHAACISLLLRGRITGRGNHRW